MDETYSPVAVSHCLDFFWRSLQMFLLMFDCLNTELGVQVKHLDLLTKAFHAGVHHGAYRVHSINHTLVSTLSCDWLIRKEIADWLQVISC